MPTPSLATALPRAFGITFAVLLTILRDALVRDTAITLEVHHH